MMARAPTIRMQWDARAMREAVSGLRDLEGRFRRGAVREAVRKSAAPMRTRARALAPVEFGFTKKSIGTKVKTYKDGNVVAVTGPRRGPKFVYQGTRKPIVLADRTVIAMVGQPVKRVPANTAHLVEFGTQPHSLGKGSSAGRGPGQKGRSGQQRGAMHPGTPPRPFMRPAFDQTVGATRALFARNLAVAIPKFLARQQARAAQRAAGIRAGLRRAA